MKRFIAMVLAAIMATACFSAAYAEGDRGELFVNISSLCLTMAREYVNAYKGGSERDEYVVAAYRYYEAYLETNGVSIAESYVKVGFMDSGALEAEKMLAFGMLNNLIRDAYEKWLNGEGEASQVIRLIDGAVAGTEKVR